MAHAVLVQNHDAGVIDDEELLLLMNFDLLGEDEVENNEPIRQWPRFNFDLWNDTECWTDLRFRKLDIPRICDELELEIEMVTYNGVKFSNVEGLCLLLRRLAFPCRYVDLIPKFGRPKAVLCVIFNHMLSLIYERFNHLLVSMNQPWLSPESLTEFANKIHDKGAPLENCWGFIDGTVRPIVRPGINQRVQWS